MRKPINVALIGAGGIARNVHLPSLTEMDDVKIVAICDLVEKRAAERAEQYGIPSVYTVYWEMLEKEDIDAVFCLVEPANLFHVVHNSLARGCDVFMEKPPGLTLYQTRSLARKADEAGRILHVGFNRRYIPLVKHVLGMFADANAQINHVDAAFVKCGNAAFDRGSLPAFESDTVHGIDLVRAIAGGVPTKAALIAGTSAGDPFDNRWSGICEFDTGVSGTIKANYRTGGRVHYAEIHAPGMSAYIDMGFGPPACRARVLVHKGAECYSLASAGAANEGIIELDGLDIAGSPDFHRYYGYFSEDREFIDCVRSREQPETNIHDAVKTMELIELFRKNTI